MGKIRLFYKQLHISGRVDYMRLVIEEVIDEEIIHYVDNNQIILSTFNKVCIKSNNDIKIIKLPVSIVQKFLGILRITRRLFRLDKMCIIPTVSGYVVFWQGAVYLIDKDILKPRKIMNLTGCRNPLHNAVACINGKELYFGEYGKEHPDGKTIYHSIDGGISWKTVYNISCDKIRHIHCCKWDPFDKKIWVFTGDYDGQCYILCADRNFENVEWIGDGTQYYRACNVFFEKDSVHWIMDSPLQEVHHIKLERKTRKIEIKQAFDGPVWYTCKLQDGYYLAATSQEIGPSHKDDKLHLMVTRDLDIWEEIASFNHDGLPKGYLKFGVMGFADGVQSSSKLHIFLEAVEGFDGKSCICRIISQ